MDLTKTVIRFIVSALVLMGISFLLPGFTLIGFTNALIAAVVIALLGYIIESFLGENLSPQNRGLVGFISSAVVIYLAQFVVTGMGVSLLGAVLAALIIGVVDAFIPTQLR